MFSGGGWELLVHAKLAMLGGARPCGDSAPGNAELKADRLENIEGNPRSEDIFRFVPCGVDTWLSGPAVEGLRTATPFPLGDGVELLGIVATAAAAVVIILASRGSWRRISKRIVIFDEC
ncbi:bhlh transcription factor-like protein [Moniliophthora roreri]|nr:bhlh transcription factor-like protein [Moniliophthora roreri]